MSRPPRAVAGAALLAAALACASRPSPATEPFPGETPMAGEGPGSLGPGPSPAPAAAAPPPAAPATAPPATCEAFHRPGVIRRAAINRTITAGLGRWLAEGGVDVVPQLGPGKRFQGWTIRSLYAGDPCYRDVDLRPGDVVRRVNGKSVEKPDQANEVFMSLRTAPSLTVEYLREGKPRQLTFPIADE